jgi:hypothetical protein
MRVTIHQPEHLPWPGFFGKASQVELLVLLDVVQFTKNGFQNRNKVLTPAGPSWITVPVVNKGHTQSTIRDMRINNTDRRWRTRSWRTLKETYGRHPHFDRCEVGLEAAYSQEWEHLAVLNEHLIHLMLDWLGMDIRVVRASDLGVAGSSSELLLAICKAVGADEYLAGPSSGEYLDESLLTEAGVGVLHARYEQQVYPQRGQDAFVGNLSTIDMLSNCGDDSLSIISRGARCE